MFRTPRPNESEAGTPQASAWGRAFRALVTGRPRPTVAGSRGLELPRGAGLVREQPAVLQDQPTPYRDFIGVFYARAARLRPVVMLPGYAGELPLDQQPKVKRVNPWTDPTRGLP